MMYKQIFNTAVAVTAAAVFCIGCGDMAAKPDEIPDDYVGKGNDINNYRTVTIGTQTWMAENLDYNVPNVATDKCYNNSADSCAKYGRLYDWKTAKIACPTGWHLPSDAEWTRLENAVGGRSTAGKKLKSTSGWRDFNGVDGNGTDDYDFSALPGGQGYGGSIPNGAGAGGWFWSATEYDVDNAIHRLIRDDIEGVSVHYGGKDFLFSVRCVAD